MKIFIANWKLHSDLSMARNFLQKLKGLKELEKNKIVICPPLLYLHSLQDILKFKNFELGAQDVFITPDEKETGSISAENLKEANVSWVILGHSEQIKRHNMNLNDINKKLMYTLEKNLNAVLCVGEGLMERRQNMQFDVVKDQLHKILDKVPSFFSKNIVIAYEPVWSIGSSKAASVSDIMSMTTFLKKELSKLGFKDSRVIYGGSVHSGNAAEILSVPEIEGLLIGRSGVEVNELYNIANAE